MWFVVVVALLLLMWWVARGQDLSAFDQPAGEQFSTGAEPGEEHDAVVASLMVGAAELMHLPRRERLGKIRAYMDNMSAGRQFDASFTTVDAGGVPAEWVCATGADSNRRVLYIHGGAYMMGSPVSHRVITCRFSQVANAAVLAIDYRLMPEHSRLAGIEDCRTAYRWLVDNGPQGSGAATRVFVAGDSAGGNLTLSLIAWLRNQPLRQPDAAIALSPHTDSTMSAPSIRNNVETDAMLAPMFSWLAKMPRPLLWWVNWAQYRVCPASALVSPLLGELSGLPPTLVHASEAEMMLDDARRYVNRAVAAGSPAKLQTWEHVVHVWHMFDPDLTEARQAWGEIEKFIADLEC